jgi:sugar lactone lactonase YvrE
LLLVALVAACSPGEEIPADLTAPADALVWPAPPQRPRIKFVRAFRDPRDLKIAEPLFGQLWNLLAGEKNRAMTKPYALAVDGPKVAVSDPGAFAVHIYDTKARTYTRITDGESEPLRSPVGVAFGHDRVYVADSELAKVFAYDDGGEFLFAIGGVARPTGLAYDRGGRRLYVADTMAHRIAVFNDEGAPLFVFGDRGGQAGEFNFPTHLRVRGDRLYVNDTMNFRIQIFELDGNHLRTFGTHGDGSGNFAQPKGVGVDSEGNIYVADAMFDRVQIFDPNGRFLLSFGGNGSVVGTFWLPGGVFVEDDLIYVADSYNRRVQVFQFMGGD